MATFLFDFVSQLDEQWHEVDVLLDKAKEIRESDDELYNALCRSITVLIVAHLEGFTKDLAKYIIKDLNNSVEFKNLPTAVKRTYCKKYLGDNAENKDRKYENKLSKLIEKFEELNCKISHEPFFYPINKNPNPNVIEQMFSNFGIMKIFQLLHESEFDNVFSESPSETNERIEATKTELLHGTVSFPYLLDVSRFDLKKSMSDGRVTLWVEFLEQINQKRHDVAHGNEFDNGEDVNSLVRKKNKLVLLELALTGVLSLNIKCVHPNRDSL